MIAIENLTVRYRAARPHNRIITALSGVSLTVPQGTVCAIIGPSGCGKSTLLKVIAGLIRPAEGSVTIDGCPVNPRQTCIGFMPQNYGLLPWKTVRQNILLGCEIRGSRKDTRGQGMQEFAAKLHIAELLDRYPHELSGGQQQRVGLARAFLLQPDLLLMDEPFSALDAITRETMQDVFLTLWQQQSVTTLLVTHYVEEALCLGQKIVLMAAQPGRVAKVIDNPLGGHRELRNTTEFFRQGQALREAIWKLEVEA